MLRCVVGFMFDSTLERVVLIRKRRPYWQCGLVNGVGGKIEPGETPLQAMEREFREESGIHTGDDIGIPWKHFLNIKFEGVEIDFFYAIGPIWEAKTITDEFVGQRLVQEVLFSHDIMPNLKWIIPLALHSMRPMNNDLLDLPIKITGTHTS